jgi:hypothetical protein
MLMSSTISSDSAKMTQLDQHYKQLVQQQQLQLPAPHLTYVKLESVQVGFKYKKVLDWCWQNASGRFWVGHLVQGTGATAELVVGFEQPRDASFFALKFLNVS